MTIFGAELPNLIQIDLAPGSLQTTPNRLKVSLGEKVTWLFQSTRPAGPLNLSLTFAGTSPFHWTRIEFSLSDTSSRPHVFEAVTENPGDHKYSVAVVNPETGEQDEEDPYLKVMNSG